MGGGCERQKERDRDTQRQKKREIEGETDTQKTETETDSDRKGEKRHGAVQSVSTADILYSAAHTAMGSIP